MQNNKKQNYKILYIIPVSISIILLFFQLGYAYFNYNCTNEIIALLRNNQIDQASIKAIEEFLLQFDKQYLLTGLEIIGIAISVWIGLNIYNIVKKDDIENLEKLVSKTENAHELFINDYKNFNLSSLSYATLYEDRVNDFFIEELLKINDSELGYKIIESVFLQEKYIKKLIYNYEHDNLPEMQNQLTNFLNEIEKSKEEVSTIKNKHSKKIFEAFIAYRIADYNYYYALYLIELKKSHTNIKNYEKKQIETNQTQLIIEYLKKALKHYEFVINNNEKNKDNQKLRSHMYNVEAHTNFLLYQNTNVVKYIEKAVSCSRMACSNVYDTPIETNYARDHRNYGVNIENLIMAQQELVTSENWYESMFAALKQYNIALKFDKKDVKTLTSITSCILKIFDHKIQLDDKSKNTYLNLTTIFNDGIILNEIIIPDYKSYVDLLDIARNSIQKAQLLNNFELACHYHAIHVYMYLYLITEDFKLKSNFKESGLKEIDTCIVLCNGNTEEYPLGFKYKARNFYYAIGDNEKGKYFNDLI